MCELNPGDPPEGVTDAIKSQLMSRKRRPDASEEEKWKGIYGILFPSEEAPSPCRFPPPVFSILYPVPTKRL